MLPNEEVIDTALRILKANGEFRGGDPEEIEQKREEKEQEEADLDKADPGEEPGEFRGGDPEELQEKKQQKQEEKEESGEEDEDQEDAGDDLTEDELADLKENENKALPVFSDVVSPLPHSQDIVPLDYNGDPFEQRRNSVKERDIPKGPFRPGENQHKVWSEQFGLKFPLTGDATAELRRYTMLGKDKEAAEVFQRLARSFNFGVLFEARNITGLGKSERGSVKAGHLYIHRWVGKDGRWQYAYKDEPHVPYHGIEHTGAPGGHSMDVHPAWLNKDKDLNNPEGAFHHARQTALMAGGSHTVKLPDIDNSDKVVEHTISFNKENAKPIKVDSGKGEPRRFKNFEAFDDFMRQKHVSTEPDVHGNPYLQWRVDKKGKYQTRTIPNSEFHTDIKGERKGGWVKKDFIKSPEDVQEYIKRLHNDQSTAPHRIEHPSIEHASASDIKKEGDKPFTSAIEQGYFDNKRGMANLHDWSPKGTHKDLPEDFHTLSEKEKSKIAKKGPKLGKRIKYKSSEDKYHFARNVFNEHHQFKADNQGNIIGGKGPAFNAARELLVKEFKVPATPELVNELVTSPHTLKGVTEALTTYDPEKRKDWTLKNHLKKYIKKNQFNAFREMAAGYKQKMAETGGDVERRGAASRKVEGVSSDVQDIFQEAAGGLGKALSILKAKQEENKYPDVNYIGQFGEKEAPIHYYDTGEGGNLVQGTNAPIGHEHHDERFGDPVLSENEISPESHPNYFSEDGQKLDRPIPDGVQVEDNLEYNSDRNAGQFWVKRYQDPSTGDHNYIYSHKDQISDPKLRHNLALRYVDSQLPKIRQWYQQNFAMADLEMKTVALMLALFDQAKLWPEEHLLDLQVKDLQWEEHHSVIFNLKNGMSPKITLDRTPALILQQLVADKNPEDLVFVVNNQIFDYGTFSRFMRDTFGIVPQQWKMYQVSEFFAKEFGKHLRQFKAEYPNVDVEGIKNGVLESIAEYFHEPDPTQLSQYVDPIVYEAVVLSSHLMPSEQGNSISKAVFGAQSVNWHVTVNPPDKDQDEELFSQWIHTYPLHEHYKHWNAYQKTEGQSQEAAS